MIHKGFFWRQKAVAHYNGSSSKSLILEAAIVRPFTSPSLLFTVAANIAKLMSFLIALQSRLTSLLVAFLFVCTAFLGAVLLAVQRLLDWVDGQHPFLTGAFDALRRGITRYPKTLMASLASLLIAGGGGAFAVANLGPDISDLPVVNITTPVDIAHIQAQAASLDLVDLQLTRTDTTRSADTPENLLRRLGLVDTETAAFLRKNPLAKLALQQAGRSVSAEVNSDQQLRSLRVRWLKNENDTFFQRLVIKRTPQGLEAALEASPMNTSLRMTGGTVARSLYDAADEARLPDAVINQLTQIFSNQIDFHRTLRKGARFSVVYEVLEADGEPLRTGRVLSAEFTNDNQQFEAVWFQEPGQKGSYYDMEGKSLSRAYLAAPLAFSRTTSGFSMRLHPIFQTMRAHQGVDYAAPTGTPAQSVGDGVVEFAGVQGGYGNMVIVNHGGNHSTVYAHLSRIQVKKGQTVQKGQVVGAVGSTGWSTGPHLHFEFRVGGVHVDPQKIIQMAQSTPISPAEKPRFNTLVTQARMQLQAAAQMRESNIQ